jgi:hypothetical protein
MKFGKNIRKICESSRNGLRSFWNDYEARTFTIMSLLLISTATLAATIGPQGYCFLGHQVSPTVRTEQRETGRRMYDNFLGHQIPAPYSENLLENTVQSESKADSLGIE